MPFSRILRVKRLKNLWKDLKINWKVFRSLVKEGRISSKTVNQLWNTSKLNTVERSCRTTLSPYLDISTRKRRKWIQNLLSSYHNTVLFRSCKSRLSQINSRNNSLILFLRRWTSSHRRTSLSITITIVTFKIKCSSMGWVIIWMLVIETKSSKVKSKNRMYLRLNKMSVVTTTITAMAMVITINLLI